MADKAKTAAKTKPKVTVHYDEPAPGKRHYCIIGGGATGLSAIKELTAMGHKVTCFEELPRVGGVYAKSYDGTLLTTSSLLTAFSDYSDGKEARPRFWNDEEYLWVLDGFAHKFGLMDHIQFRTRVEKVYRCPKSKKWRVTVRRDVFTWPHRSTFLLGRSVSTAKREEAKNVLGKQVLEDFYAKAEKFGYENVKKTYDYDYFDHKTGEKVRMSSKEPPVDYSVEYAFDGLIVATGTNNWASLPRFKGQENFTGRLIHTEDYKKPEVFAGQRVLIVGAGESGSDICNEVASYASKVAMVCRGKHGHVIPRKQADGRVTDLNTNRVRYSNPYILGDWVGWANQHAKKFVAKYSSGKDPEESQILQTIGKLNLQQKTSAFSKFGCKNEGFVTAMVTHGAELHRDDFRLGKDRAIFNDGSEFECDVIIACTGFRNSFPFFLHPDICDDVFCPASGLTYKELANTYVNPRLLWKQSIHPLTPDATLCFCGFTRPAFGSVPPTVEMQTRMIALIASGFLKLPDTQELKRQARVDQENYNYRFGYDAIRVKGLVDFQLYCDDVARQIGALPPLGRIFWEKPKLWWKIMFSTFTMHQYRLVGPYANPQVAEAVYSRVLSETSWNAPSPQPSS